MALRDTRDHAAFSCSFTGTNRYIVDRHALALSFIGDLAGAESRLRQAEDCIGPESPPAAVAWADAAGLMSDDLLAFTREAEYLILARVWIAQAREGASGDDLSRALRLLDRLRSDAAPKARQARVVEALILQALALAAQGDGPGALAALGLALSLAAPEGYVRLLVDEGRPLQLRRQRLVARRLAYVLLLLTAIVVEPRAGQRHAEPRPNSQSPRAPQRSSMTRLLSKCLTSCAWSPPATRTPRSPRHW